MSSGAPEAGNWGWKTNVGIDPMENPPRRLGRGWNLPGIPWINCGWNELLVLPSLGSGFHRVNPGIFSILAASLPGYSHFSLEYSFLWPNSLVPAFQILPLRGFFFVGIFFPCGRRSIQNPWKNWGAALFVWERQTRPAGPFGAGKPPGASGTCRGARGATDGSGVPAENRESPAGRSEAVSGRPGFLEKHSKVSRADPTDPAHPALEASGILALPPGSRFPFPGASGKG